MSRVVPLAVDGGVLGKSEVLTNDGQSAAHEKGVKDCTNIVEKIFTGEERQRQCTNVAPVTYRARYEI